MLVGGAGVAVGGMGVLVGSGVSVGVAVDVGVGTGVSVGTSVFVGVGVWVGVGVDVGGKSGEGLCCSAATDTDARPRNNARRLTEISDARRNDQEFIRVLIVWKTGR